MWGSTQPSSATPSAASHMTGLSKHGLQPASGVGLVCCPRTINDARGFVIIVFVSFVSLHALIDGAFRVAYMCVCRLWVLCSVTVQLIGCVCVDGIFATWHHIVAAWNVGTRHRMGASRTKKAKES